MVSNGLELGLIVHALLDVVAVLFDIGLDGFQRLGYLDVRVARPKVEEPLIRAVELGLIIEVSMDVGRTVRVKLTRYQNLFEPLTLRFEEGQNVFLGEVAPRVGKEPTLGL
jgi:hypothetical protein